MVPLPLQRDDDSGVFWSPVSKVESLRMEEIESISSHSSRRTVGQLKKKSTISWSKSDCMKKWNKKIVGVCNLRVQNSDTAIHASSAIQEFLL